MSWLLSFVIGVLTAVTGCLCAGFVASLCVRWYRISSFEGGSGYFVVFTALFGAIAGFFLGFISSRFMVSPGAPWFGKALLVAMGATTGIALVVGALCWLAADIAPTIDGRNLELDLEIRLPASFAAPSREELESASAAIYVIQGRLQPSSRPSFTPASGPRQRPSATVKVRLDTSASRKFLQLSFGKEKDFLFPLRLKARPGKRDLEWSPWIEAAWEAGKPRPEEDERAYVRYRVVLIQPPPPRPSAAEEEAQKQKEEQAAFDAIDPRAPVREWLPFTRTGVAGPRLAAAIRNITERETFLQEFSDILKSGDIEEISDALRMVEHIENPSPAFVAPVTDFGRDLIRRMQKVNASRPEADPGYEGFAEISQRFSAWMAAVRPLRVRCGGDFVPELKQITALARVRKDSVVMRSDVLRVASYYLKEWAGIPPEPDDPKP